MRRVVVEVSHGPAATRFHAVIASVQAIHQKRKSPLRKLQLSSRYQNGLRVRAPSRDHVFVSAVPRGVVDGRPIVSAAFLCLRQGTSPLRDYPFLIRTNDRTKYRESASWTSQHGTTNIGATQHSEAVTRMADERLQRRLAAIAVADVVGYSRMMEADEVGTLAALKERWTVIVQPTVLAYGGRIVKVMATGR